MPAGTISMQKWLVKQKLSKREYGHVKALRTLDDIDPRREFDVKKKFVALEMREGSILCPSG